MNTGYERPLDILPFDHRHSYITGVFHWQEPLTSDQVDEIVASKQVIYDGFKAAVVDPAVRDRAGILVDRGDCEKIVEAARRGGRTTAGCIVLGRGSDEQAVVRWLTVAAGVQGFIGFAVGRTTWLDAVTKWRAHTIGREIAVAQIAGRFPEWAAIFEHV